MSGQDAAAFEAGWRQCHAAMLAKIESAGMPSGWKVQVLSYLRGVRFFGVNR